MKHNAKVVLANGTLGTVVTVLPTTIAGTIDTLGFRYASIAVLGSGDTHSASTTLTNHAVEQSDASGSGFAAISGFTAGTDWTPTTTAIGTTTAKIVYNVDLRGKKRYLKVTFGANSGSYLSVVGVLTNPENGVATATEQNAAFTVNG